MTHFCLEHEIRTRKCDITVLTENGLSSGAAVPVPGAPKGFSSKPDIWTAISCQEFGIYLPYTHNSATMAPDCQLLVSGELLFEAFDTWADEHLACEITPLWTDLSTSWTIK